MNLNISYRWSSRKYAVSPAKVMDAVVHVPPNHAATPERELMEIVL